MVTSATDWFASCTKKFSKERRELSSVLTTATAHAPRLSMPPVVLDEGSVKEKVWSAAVMGSGASLMKLSGSLKTTVAPEVGASDTFTQTSSPRPKELCGVVQPAANVAMGGSW